MHRHQAYLVASAHVTWVCQRQEIHFHALFEKKLLHLFFGAPAFVKARRYPNSEDPPGPSIERITDDHEVPRAI